MTRLRLGDLVFSSPTGLIGAVGEVFLTAAPGDAKSAILVQCVTGAHQYYRYVSLASTVAVTATFAGLVPRAAPSTR